MDQQDRIEIEAFIELVLERLGDNWEARALSQEILDFSSNGFLIYVTAFQLQGVHVSNLVVWLDKTVHISAGPSLSLADSSSAARAAEQLQGLVNV